MISVFIGLLIVLMVIGVPVAFALGFTNLVALILDRGIGNIPYEVIAQRLVYALDNFPVLAVPFFLLAGKLMNVGGITDRIFNFVNCVVGYVRGGLGHVNVVASMIFAHRNPMASLMYAPCPPSSRICSCVSLPSASASIRKSRLWQVISWVWYSKKPAISSPVSAAPTVWDAATSNTRMRSFPTARMSADAPLSAKRT